MYKLALVALFVQIVDSANILCYFPFPSYSHQITFQPIWKELALRGHQVTVFTPNPLKDKSIHNLIEIDLHDISYDIMEKYNISSIGVDEELDSTDITPLMQSMKEIMEAQLSHPEVKHLILNMNNTKYDLLILEMSMPHTYTLKEVYNCPMIFTLSMPLHFNADEYFGNVNHPIMNPDLNLPFSRNLTFFERVKSVSHNIAVRFFFSKFITVFQDMTERHYGREYNMKIIYEASLVLTNTNPILHPRKPGVPNIIEFSGIHILAPKALPTDLQQFLDNSKKGVIYMSLGSGIKSSAFGQERINIILKTFSELPYNFLWKFEKEDLPNKPKNVEIRNWLPQMDVLRHPNVKLFITQGGLQSLDEAMYSKTPVVAIPFFADQFGNSRKVVDIGMGVSFQKSELSVETLTKAIEEAVSEKYAKRAEEIYDIITDKPMSALEETVWWIEYVLRHKDVSHLRTAALTIPWYQYFMLDVIGFFIAILLAMLFTLFIVCKSVIRCFFPAKKLKKN